MKPNVLLTLLTFLGIFSPPVIKANISLIIPEVFNIKSVNGQPFTQPLLQASNTITLNSGINKVALEFEAVYEDEDNDSFDIIKSDIFIINAYLQENQIYRLRFLKPKDSRAARKYVKQPLVDLFNQNGERTHHQQQFADTSAMSAIHRLTRKPIIKQAPIILTSKTINDATNPNQSGHYERLRSSGDEPGTPLENLEYWWSQASSKEKKLFLESVKDSAKKENSGND
jgi:uncharacterized protein YccT (UPF0319 family)